MPELDVGVTVGYAILSRLLPPPMARRALLTSERVEASVLDRLGAAVVVPPAELAEVATGLATGLLGKPPGMVALARRSWGGGERELTARRTRRKSATSSPAERSGGGPPLPGPLSVGWKLPGSLSVGSKRHRDQSLARSPAMRLLLPIIVAGSAVLIAAAPAQAAPRTRPRR